MDPEVAPSFVFFFAKGHHHTESCRGLAPLWRRILGWLLLYSDCGCTFCHCSKLGQSVRQWLAKVTLDWLVWKSIRQIYIETNNKTTVQSKKSWLGLTDLKTYFEHCFVFLASKTIWWALKFVKYAFQLYIKDKQWFSEDMESNEIVR